MTTHFIKYFTLLALFCQAIASCKNNEPAPPPAPPQPVGRTVLVYMLANNNGLGSTDPYDYDAQDIDEMASAARDGQITDGRLIVFHSATNGNQVLKEILPSGQIDTLKIYPSTTRPQTSARMAEVIADTKANAPADDYGLVLWGHGSGWLEDGIRDSDPSQAQTYAYGSEHNDLYKMNITSLAHTLQGQDFSFIYFDCCYMASVEALYQLRHTTHTIVASATELLVYGMPYDRNVACFFTPEPDLITAAQNTFNFYDAMLNPRYRMCTISVINTSALQELAAATKAIYAQNTTGLPPGYSPQPFTTSRPYYYCDFASYVRALQSTPQTLDAFEKALSKTVLLKLATQKIWNQLPINEHCGLSTFIMESDADFTRKNYNTLAWFNDVAAELIKP